MRKVTQVWEEPGRPGNLSVIGHLRAGKTSLVWHALSLMDRTDLAVLQINVVIHASALDLFRAIAGQLADEVDGLDEAAGAVRAARDWYDLSNAVTALFKEVADRGRYVLLVLDEFDRAPLVLADLSAFQLLRSLASEPEYPVGLITISRRAVIDIETDAAGGSRLDGVLGERCYVGTFTAREAAELIGRARPVVDLSGAADEITGRVGRHPYLLPALCARIVERYLVTGTVDVAAAYELQRADFAEYFDRLLRDIDADSDGRGSATLIEIARGADPASYPLEVQKLISTGVVERTAGRSGALLRGVRPVLGGAPAGHVHGEAGPGRGPSGGHRVELAARRAEHLQPAALHGPRRAAGTGVLHGARRHRRGGDHGGEGGRDSAAPRAGGRRTR